MNISVLEHTADLGVEVEADTLREVFEGAAEGMFSIMVDTGKVSQSETVEVELEAGDLEGLMFDWLNELLFTADSRGMLFSGFRVLSIDEEHLEAEVSGEKLDKGKHPLEGEVKAATYHRLAVERTDGGWFVRVVFDV